MRRLGQAEDGHLLALGLVAHRPWKRDAKDGVWQLLPLAGALDAQERSGPVAVADVLSRLGLSEPLAQPQHHEAERPAKPNPWEEREP